MLQAEYTRRSPLDAPRRAWHEVLHTTRMVGLLFAPDAAAGPGERALEAWRPTLPSLLASLRQLTGIVVER